MSKKDKESVLVERRKQNKMSRGGKQSSEDKVKTNQSFY